MKKKVKQNIEVFYVDVPFACKDDIQLMYNIKWDMDKKSWFTNNEKDVQQIEKKVEIFRNFHRECFEKSHEIVVKYVDFILDVFPPLVSHRQGIADEFYKEPIKCLDLMRASINFNETKEKFSGVLH